ncbi:response regulator transcription factor [Paraflavisolibacter sp. H34]|uniref:response regulator n=1 Tax=Huijunlia imazamoxiresistens TaxID=3127457 RepID=UPI00301AA5A6
MATIAIVDDFDLFREAFTGFLQSAGHEVVWSSGSGKAFILQLQATALPQIVLLDSELCEKEEYETARWLQEHLPQTKVLVLAVTGEEEDLIIRMLKNGSRGFLLKTTTLEELKAALKTLMKKGFYAPLINMEACLFPTVRFRDTIRSFKKKCEEGTGRSSPDNPQ